MTRSNSKPRPRTGLRLTPRDLAMLESLYTARYLTIRALEWLHMPTWRTRWARHQAQTPERPYYPSTALYTRLKRLGEQGLIEHIQRVTQLGRTVYGREDGAYVLTPAGVQLLAHYRQLPPDALTVLRPRPRSYFTLSHGVEIGQVYAALRAALAAKPDVQLVDWAGEHITARAYDRIAVRRIGAHGNAEEVELAVQPDATGVLVHAGGRERLFLELDRGTRPVRTWVEKLEAYAAYMGSAALRARYATETFVLLTIAPDATQCQTLMQATAGVVHQRLGRYLFGLAATVHPLTIGTHWQRITTVTPTGQRTRPTITTEPYTLIHAAADSPTAPAAEG